MSPGNPFVLGSKGQRSRSRVTKKKCRRGFRHFSEWASSTSDAT